MGLLDLTTNLKSLKFGRDIRGGGNSLQPFIQTPIPGTFEELDANSTDFLLRDGSLSRSATDLLRTSKFLTTVDGILFVAKQTALSSQNPIIPGRPNRSIPIGGLYNPLLTLSQVGINAIGGHIERQGLLPINDSQTKYFSIYKNQFNTEGTNKLSILYNSKINPDPPLLFSTAIAAPLLSLNTDPDSLTLISYPRGEGGFSTNITIQNPTIGKNNLPEGEPLETYQVGRGPFFGRGGYKLGGEGINVVGASAAYFIYDEINGNVIGDPELELLTGITPDGQQIVPYGVMDDNSTLSTDTKGLILKDYQVGLANSTTDRTNLPTPYSVINPNTGVSSSAANPISYRAYAMKPGFSDPIGLNVSNDQRNEELEGQQICKFFFELINNTANASSEFIYFRAYLDSIKDSYGADWSSVKYSGRAEQFYQYQGFNRSISLGFSILAHSKEELNTMYEKMNKLTNMITPDYSDLGYMRGTIVRLTVGDYFKSVPGVVNSINFDNHLDTGWDLVEGRQAPKYLKVSCDFSPIHDFLPQKGAEFYKINPVI